MIVPERRLFLIVLCLSVYLCSATLAISQSGRVQPTPTPTPDETERVVTEEIKLNVLAFDENGQFFRDVTDRDLVITENNILHQPTSVRRLPANVLVVMDTGGELRSVKSLDRTRKVAASLVSSLRAGDSVAIVQYSDRAEVLMEWTSDKNQALAAIKRSGFGRRSAFSDALKVATDMLMRDPIENRHLVLITDGTDSGSRSPNKTEAFRRLLTTNISVHVLSYTSLEAIAIEPRTKTVSNDNTPRRTAMPPEIVDTLPNDVKIAAQRPKIGPTINLDRTLLKKLNTRKADLQTAEKELEQLAENTNGEFILPGTVDEMEQKAALVSRMIDSSYVVTYTPKVPVVDTRGMAERTIDVTSKRPGLVVQARRKLLINMAKK
jgi:VWFA-related protein